MEVVRNVARMRHLSHRLHGERKRLALVPTWGGLHEGHVSLVRRARELADVTLVSILTNRADAQSESDERSHPITLTQDVELLIPTGVDYVFAPKMEEFRHPEMMTDVVIRGLTERLFGSVRPRFYVQASTLLVALFNIINPDVVCLGEKDPQLLAIARQLVTDLHFSFQLTVAPIVREPDGVAASWWLQRMTPPERQAATAVYKALEKAQVLFGAGEREAADLVKAMDDVLKSDILLQVDYIGIVDLETLEPVASIGEAPALVAIAATIGEAHLTDCIMLNE
jgi:pantoate--beta-alanine ligase